MCTEVYKPANICQKQSQTVIFIPRVIALLGEMFLCTENDSGFFIRINSSLKTRDKDVGFDDIFFVSDCQLTSQTVA